MAKRLHGVVCSLLILPVLFTVKSHTWILSLSSSFLKVPGADLQNVCHLQTPEDASKVLELASGKNLVIVGASFIGTMLEGLLGLEKVGPVMHFCCVSLLISIN